MTPGALATVVNPHLVFIAHQLPRLRERGVVGVIPAPSRGNSMSSVTVSEMVEMDGWK
jgi:hypothetical protein